MNFAWPCLNSSIHDSVLPELIHQGNANIQSKPLRSGPVRMAESLHLLTSTHVSKPPEASTSVESNQCQCHLRASRSRTSSDSHIGNLARLNPAVSLARDEEPSPSSLSFPCPHDRWYATICPRLTSQEGSEPPVAVLQSLPAPESQGPFTPVIVLRSPQGSGRSRTHLMRPTGRNASRKANVDPAVSVTESSPATPAVPMATPPNACMSMFPTKKLAPSVRRKRFGTYGRRSAS